MSDMSLFDFSNVDVLGVWKDGFIVAYITATVGVVFGVYWERESFPKEVQEYGWDVLVKSLAVELLCGTLIFSIDGRIARIQRDAITALEMRLAARSLSDKQASEITKAMSRYPGQHFVLFSYRYKEASDIADQIGNAVIKAGWQKDPLPPNMVLLSVLGGISINVDDGAPDPVKEAAHQLSNMLNSDDIAATEDHRNNATDKAQIGIAIGIKP